MKLLKQKTSGELYVWDAELAKRDDMEDYAQPEVQSEIVPVEQVEIEVADVPQAEEPAPVEAVVEEAVEEAVETPKKKKAK